MKQKKRKYGDVFDVTIDGTSKREVLRKIDFSLKKRTKLFITTPNPEILLASRNNPKLKESLNESDIRICDGTGLKLALMFKGHKAERIRGRELLVDLFEVANRDKLKIYFLGSSDEVIESSINRLNDEYPNIEVRGNSGPVLDGNANLIPKLPSSESFEGSLSLPARIPAAGNFLKENKMLGEKVVQEIKEFRPDILVVAFGAPKQEIWISKYKKELPVHIFIGVGGSLDYYSGVKAVPPRWLAYFGFEWLWRAVHEPKRIIRIFRAVVVFPIAVLFFD